MNPFLLLAASFPGARNCGFKTSSAFPEDINIPQGGSVLSGREGKDRKQK
jgi:hypothetical protein